MEPGLNASCVPTDTTPDRRESPAQAVLRLTGGVILAVAAIAAVSPAIQFVLAGPRLAGLSGRVVGGAFAGGGVVLALGYTAGLAVLAVSRPRAALALASVGFLLTRLAYLVGWDVPLISDWRSYHELALGWLQGAPPIADQPMGYPILLGEAYRFGGVSTASAEALGLVSAIGGAAALVGLVRITAGSVASVAALALLTLTPSQLLFTAVAGSEALYSAILTAAALGAAVVLGRLERPPLRSVVGLACLLGIGLALSSHVRATSLAVAPFLALLPVVARANRSGLTVAVAVVAGVIVGLAPATALNLRYLDKLSPATSTYFGWQLYVGANVETGGRFSPEDAARVDAAVPGYYTGSIPNAYAMGDFDPARLRKAAERDRVAMDLAVDRAVAANVRLVPLVAHKAWTGWGRADAAAAWAMDAGQDERGSPEFRLARIASQSWWVVLLALGAIAQLTGRGRLPLVAAAVLVPVTLGIFVLEAQPRYHEYAVPVVAALAGVAVARGVTRVIGPQPARLDRMTVPGTARTT